MKAVTIRGVEPKVAEKLKLTAAQQGKSVNQLTIDIIKESLGMQKTKIHSRKYNDLDDLFGRWNEAEFKKINERISHARKIDQELWP